MSKITYTLPSQVIKNCFSVLKRKFLPQCRSRLTHTRSFRNENINQDFIDKIRLAVGKEKFSTALAVCKQYGTDEGCHGTSAVDIVTYPYSVKDVCQIVDLCNTYRVPAIAHGAGTGLEHGIGAIMGGVSVDLTHLNSVVELNVEDFDCTVEAGITRKTLEAYLKQTGLMFPVDPGADASIGGMASTSASGTNAVLYGTMKENVLNLEVVLADGSILHTGGPGRRARKSSAGYNLTELFVGSEGTLGIITKVTLRLHAVPEMMISAVSSFQSVQEAVSAVVEILQNNIPVARIELLDEMSMAITNKYGDLNFDVSPSLFFEFHGSADIIRIHVKEVEELLRTNYNAKFLQADDSDARKRLWKARHEIYYSTLAQKPGFKVQSLVMLEMVIFIHNFSMILTVPKSSKWFTLWKRG